MVGGPHEDRQRPLAQAQALEHLDPVGLGQQGGLGLQLHAHADDLGAPTIGSGALQFGDHRRQDGPRVHDLVLVEVHHGQDRLVGQQEVGTQFGAVRRGEVAAVQRHALPQEVDGPTQGGHRGAQRRIALGRPTHLVELLLRRVQIGQGEFHLDDPQVLQRIRRAGHVGVGEGPQHEHDGVHLADPGQELVAQALPLGCPLDQPPDISELHAGWHDLARGAHLGQPVQTIIGHLGHADVRVRGGEGVRSGQRATPGQGVVQRRLARVGQANESEPLHLGPPGSVESPRPARRPATGGAGRIRLGPAAGGPTAV